MKREYSMDDLEERADQLLKAALDLTEAEVDAIYNEARPNKDLKQCVFELAERAAAVCDFERRPRPPQLQAVLATSKQLELPLADGAPEDNLSPALPRVLVIDQDPDRLMARRQLLWEGQIDTEITTSAADGLARLEKGGFQWVIVDYCPRDDEQDILLMIQKFNLQVPVFNVRVWESFLRGDNRRWRDRELLKLAARLLDKPVPRSLPQKRPPLAAGTPAHEQTLFNVG